MEVLSLVKEIGIVYMIEEYLGRDPKTKHKELMKEINIKLSYNIDEKTFRTNETYNQLVIENQNDFKSVIYKEDKYGRLTIESLIIPKYTPLNLDNNIKKTTFSNYNRKLKKYTQSERSVVRYRYKTK